MSWTPHWDLYLIEAALLGLFMLTACGTCIVVLHPGLPLSRRVSSALQRRALIGAVMGTTAITLITSGWGRRSGAHMNPATTLAFSALGKVDPRDAAFYMLFQCAGGIAGVGLARALFGPKLSHPSVRFAVTQPGPRGWKVALAAEAMISFLLFMTVLLVSNSGFTAAYTPMAAGALVMAFITLEAPLSGMSMNPARTIASAVISRSFRALPVYLVGPPLGMLTAAGLYASTLGTQAVHCAKLDHRGNAPCPFHCTIEALRPSSDAGIEAVGSPQ